MMYVDSRESEWIRDKIARNKAYLLKCTNTAQYRIIQQDTLFLENNILPIVLANTMIVHDEVQKYFIRCFDTAVQHKCNALLAFIPINEDYTNVPIVGIANERHLSRFGMIGAIQVFCNDIEIINMDGNKASIKPINLPLNDFDMKEAEIYDFRAENLEFDKYLIDLSKEIKAPQPLIALADKPVFTRGNISCISGKAKSRKTFLLGLFSSQFLEYEDTAKVMIFDTEQAFYHVQKSTKRIHRLLDWNDNLNDERLKVFGLRELSTNERKKFVKEAIYHYRPDLIFIDGVRDLLNDFNNISESSEVVNLLMKISSEVNCHICAVLHENKADNSLRGHAGTELQNKAETVISVEIDGDVSKVSPKYCRNMPFDEFWFKINDEGLPEHCEPNLKPKNEDKLKGLFNELLSFGATYSYSNLVEMIIPKANVKVDMAKKKIKQALEQGIIFKNEIGYYHLPHEQVYDESLPF